jgi:hypothetical protein
MCEIVQAMLELPPSESLFEKETPMVGDDKEKPQPKEPPPPPTDWDGKKSETPPWKRGQ